MTPAALWVDGLQHFFERQLAVRIRPDRRAADASEQLAEGRVAGEIDPQGQGVDEVADQVFHLNAGAPGGGGGDEQIVLPGVAGEQHRVPGQQRHEERHPVTLAQLAQAGGQLGGKARRAGRPVESLLRGARKIGGQIQHRQMAGQALPPELHQGLQPFAPQFRALPVGVIHILNRQLGQRRRPARAKCQVQRRQFAQQYRHRPAIEDDVMDDESQHMLVRRKADESRPPGRAGVQLERLPHLLRDRLPAAVLARFPRERGQVDER